MRGLFVRTLASFVAALLVLLGTVAMVILFGFRRSMVEWGRQKEADLAPYVETVADGRTDPLRSPPPTDTPLFIFDAQRNLLYSNRGQGRRLDEKTYRPIAIDGVTVGYYTTGGLHFTEDAANQRFVASVSTVFWLSLPLSFAVAVVFALMFSRGLTAPARRVAGGLDRIAEGSLDQEIPESGTEEIVHIARSANRLRRQLASEREIRRQWAQDVAHDLRTPIAALKAQFEGMKDGVLEVGRERIGRTYNEIERIERLVTGLDELARLESPEAVLDSEELDLEALTADLVELFAAKARERRITVSRKVDARTVVADDTLLHRALANFLSNAVRHAEPGGRIEISTGRRGSATVIAVFNSGPTIPAVELEKVFDRLYRGEFARSSPGSGLGLTIARKIAELHGGSVSLESRQGRGTTAELLLPDRA